MEKGQLKVWWIPQVPMKSFEVLADNLKEAKLLLDTLADYDYYQYDNNVKSDYTNAGGLCIWNEDPDTKDQAWEDWYDEETGMDFDEYCLEHKL